MSRNYRFPIMIKHHTREEKTIFIQMYSKDKEYYVCPVCGEEYSILNKAVECCWEDCKEQADEFYRDREFYFRGDE